MLLPSAPSSKSITDKPWRLSLAGPVMCHGLDHDHDRGGSSTEAPGLDGTGQRALPLFYLAPSRLGLAVGAARDIQYQDSFAAADLPQPLINETGQTSQTGLRR